jgi:hypothetical protein
MPSDVQGPDSSGKYIPSYKMNEKTFEVWKGFWEKLFHNRADLTKDDVYKMTDTFVKFISHEMGRVLDHALKVQKAINKAQESGDSPEPT